MKSATKLNKEQAKEYLKYITPMWLIDKIQCQEHKTKRRTVKTKDRIATNHD